MIKKDKKKAAAIKYFKEDLTVPVIAAIGQEGLAEKIIEIARNNSIKIIENKDFFKFESLYSAGHEIPAEVYKIVVDILISILNTNKGLS